MGQLPRKKFNRPRKKRAIKYFLGRSVSGNIGPNSPKIIWQEVEALEGQQVRVVFSVLAVRLYGCTAELITEFSFI